MQLHYPKCSVQVSDGKLHCTCGCAGVSQARGSPPATTRLLKLRNKIWLHLIKVAGSPPADGFRLGWGPADRGGPHQVGGCYLSCIVDGQSLSQVQISVGVPLHHRGGYQGVE